MYNVSDDDAYLKLILLMFDIHRYSIHYKYWKDSKKQRDCEILMIDIDKNGIEIENLHQFAKVSVLFKLVVVQAFIINIEPFVF